VLWPLGNDVFGIRVQGWRDRLAGLVNSSWLGLQSQKLTLGGNYGEATPADLSFTLSSPGSVYSIVDAVQ
jgi:hypothetical protein